MTDAGQGTDFGCERCWPPAPDAAWEARRALTELAVLIDESHFRVRILRCEGCSQRFMSIFTETIDWKGGDDAQYWQLLPISEGESADLVRQGETLTIATLHALGPDRRCLRYDHPTGAPPRILWASGIRVRMHD